MKLKTTTGILITLLLASTFGFTTLNVSANALDKWTFMVYAVADNNLDPFGTVDLNELEMVGSSADVNILMMLDLYYEDGTWIYYVEQDDDTNVVSSPALEELEERNTGDPSTLTEFVEYCDLNYPADRNVLVLWDHGSSFIGVCWDEHTGVPDEEDHLTHEEIAEALAGYDIEVLAFDACIQAYIEVAYEYSVSEVDVEYLVGSEGFVPLDGYPYDQIADKLVGDPNIETEEFLAFLTDAFVNYYEERKGQYREIISVTLSAINVGMIGDVVTGLRTLTEALADALESEWETNHELISEAMGEAMMPWGTHGWGGALVDLVSFVDYLSPHFSEAATLSEILDSAVNVSNTIPMESCNTGGLGIFFPPSYHGFKRNPWWWVGWGELYEDTKFAAEGWLDFLYAYWNDYGRGGGVGKGRRL
jgi:hypothetical protein